MNDFDSQRKEFMKNNGFHPMVQRGTKRVKDRLEYQIISKQKENVEDMTFLKRAKKTAVAVSGGALIVVGIPFIPIPGNNKLIVLITLTK